MAVVYSWSLKPTHRCRLVHSLVDTKNVLESCLIFLWWLSPDWNHSFRPSNFNSRIKFSTFEFFSRIRGDQGPAWRQLLRSRDVRPSAGNARLVAADLPEGRHPVHRQHDVQRRARTLVGLARRQRGQQDQMGHHTQQIQGQNIWLENIALWVQASAWQSWESEGSWTSSKINFISSCFRKPYHCVHCALISLSSNLFGYLPDQLV